MSKSSITIATSAFNEEANIKRFLESVLSQKGNSFVIEKILIVSDGSTDKTVELVESFKDTRIKIIDHKERRGQSFRLNEIYSILLSDILVRSDADVVYSHDHVIRDLIQPIIKDKKVGMCGGNPLPFNPVTFTEKAVRCSLDSYLPLRSKLNDGDNIYSAMGCLLAYRKEFIKKVKIPNIIANDMFSYFSCLSLGYKYKYVPSAIVKYRLPQTLQDHIKQNIRFSSGPIRMKKYFPEDLINRELHIPMRLKLRYRLEQLIKHPILSIYIYSVNSYCRYKANKTAHNISAKWEIANSTKNKYGTEKTHSLNRDTCPQRRG